MLLRLVVNVEIYRKVTIILNHDQISIDTNHFTMRDKEALQAALYGYLHGLEIKEVSTGHNYYLISTITDLSIAYSMIIHVLDIL